MMQGALYILHCALFIELGGRGCLTRIDIVKESVFCFILSLKFRQNFNPGISSDKRLRLPVSTPTGGVLV